MSSSAEGGPGAAPGSSVSARRRSSAAALSSSPSGGSGTAPASSVSARRRSSAVPLASSPSGGSGAASGPSVSAIRRSSAVLLPSSSDGGSGTAPPPSVSAIRRSSAVFLLSSPEGGSGTASSLAEPSAAVRSSLSSSRGNFRPQLEHRPDWRSASLRSALQNGQFGMAILPNGRSSPWPLWLRVYSILYGDKHTSDRVVRRSRICFSSLTRRRRPQSLWHVPPTSGYRLQKRLHNRAALVKDLALESSIALSILLSQLPSAE